VGFEKIPLRSVTAEFLCDFNLEYEQVTLLKLFTFYFTVEKNSLQVTTTLFNVL
jgi:hypothetical protein